MTDTQVSGVLMVGSAPYASAEETFRAAMEHLSGHLARLPDGEVGERDTWIRWQYKRIGQSPQMRQQDADNVYVPFPPYEIIDGVASPDEIEFPNLGYGDAAIESYGTFSRLVEEGVIPAGVRFQVGLPAPLAVATFYVAKEHREMFEQAYGRALGREFEKMAAAIPPEKLAIQWEVVSEFALLEGIVENHLGDDLLGEINRRVAGLVDLVPEPMEAGYRPPGGRGQRRVRPRQAAHWLASPAGAEGTGRRRLLRAAPEIEPATGHRTVSRPGPPYRRGGGDPGPGGGGEKARGAVRRRDRMRFRAPARRDHARGLRHPHHHGRRGMSGPVRGMPE